MQPVKIDDPENFQYATSVIKDSKTGFTSNRRLLVIKGGHLYYYSSVPKSFDGDPKVLDYFHQLPKSSIDVLNIKRLVTQSKTSPDFQIHFDSRHMMQRQDIRKTITNEGYNFIPKDSKQETSWKFICDNHYIKQKCMGILITLIDHYQLEEQKIRKYFEDLSSNESKRNYSSQDAPSRNPWKNRDQRNYKSQIRSMIDRTQNEQQIEQFPNRFSKKDNGKAFSNTFTEEVKLEEFSMSYQGEKCKIEDAFTPSMKKKAKQNAAF